MRLFSLIALLGLGAAGAFAATHPDQVRDLYGNLYPSDPYKRDALDQCFIHDHTFNRADADAREACYRQVLAGASPAAPRDLPPPRAAEPNFIDFQRAQAQGRLPQNDIRSREQNDRYLHR